MSNTNASTSQGRSPHDDPSFRVTYNDGGFMPSNGIKTGSNDKAHRDNSTTGASTKPAKTPTGADESAKSKTTAA